jgi:hypothetical protein
MPNYRIKFSAQEPVWGEIDVLPANTPGEAEDFATDEINSLYPEYTDIEIVEVSEING